MEDLAEYFGWEFMNVQQRVPSAFELRDGYLVFSYLLIQSPYGFDIDLAAQPVFKLV